MSKKAVYVATLYDPSSMDKPLLESQDERNTDELPLDESVFSRFKISSLILGLLVGFFIQFSTLGANFLVITIWGEDVISKSKTDIVIFSLLWSLFTSAMAVIILGFIRNLVSIAFSAVTTRNDSEDVLEDMVLHMECRFVIGALIGVCLAWTMTDVLLGMNAQIVYSLATLMIALFWCRVMMMCFSSKMNNHQEEPTSMV